MSKIIDYFFVIAIFALLSACDSESKFHDLAQAIERNKLNISSIVVEPTKSITIEIGGTPCEPCETTYLSTNQTEVFTVYGLTPDNQRINISDRVVWSTSNTNIAQVTQNGTVTTQTTLGNVDVIARFASIEDRAPVIVSSATLSDSGNIIFRDNQGTVITTTPQLTMCDSYELQVVGDFGDSKRIITHNLDLNPLAGGNPTEDAKVVLNKSNFGEFSSYNPASYEVQAAYPKGATSPVINTQAFNVVETGFGNSITITPTSQTITLDTTFQFTATATVNNVSMDITNTTKWGSNDPLIALVNNTGLVTGEGVGTTQVTASCGNVSNEATVVIEEEPTLVAIKLTDTNKDPIRVLTLDLSNPDNNEKDLLVIASYTNQDDTDITADIDLNQIVIDVLSGNTPINVDRTPDDERLRVTALEVGVAVLTVVFSGQETSLTVNVE